MTKNPRATRHVAHWSLALCIAAALIALPGCGGSDKDHKDHKDHEDHSHKDHQHDDHDEHHHDAPHGGTMVELGDHFAHVELKIFDDDAQKKVVLYILSAHADKAVRLAQPTVELTVTSPAKQDGKPAEPFSVTLKAVVNENTGEKAGDSSQFEAPLDALRGLNAGSPFEAVVKSVQFPGNRAFTDVKINHAGGNAGK